MNLLVDMFFGLMCLVSVALIPIMLIVIVVRSIKKKSLKKFVIIMACSVLAFVASMAYIFYDIEKDGVITAETVAQENEAKEKEKAEKEEAERIAKEEEKAVKEAEKAEKEEAERLEKEKIEEEKRLEEESLEAEKLAEEKRLAEEEAAKLAEEQALIAALETIAAELEETRLAVTFDEIYLAYEENELRADDKYKNNRYQITATINGMTNDGLFNLTGGAMLTMECRVDNTFVFFYAEFEKEQEEALKEVNVGDTITFDGECLSAGTWVECELVQE